MSKKNILEETMTRIMQIREMQESYMNCVQALRRKDRDYQHGDRKVFNDLCQWELDEWRNLLLWGIVCDQPTRDRAKAAAHERFLSERHSVAEWLNDGVRPNKWLVADEEEFRKMAKEAFAPKGGEQ